MAEGWGHICCCAVTSAGPTNLPRAPCPCSQPEAVERLLVRLLPRASPKTLHTGDVVAFRSPLTVAAAAGAGAGGLGGFAAAALDPELLQVGSCTAAANCTSSSCWVT